MNDLPKTRAALMEYYDDQPRIADLWNQVKDYETFKVAESADIDALIKLREVFAEETAEYNKREDAMRRTVFEIRQSCNITVNESDEALKLSMDNWRLKNESNS